MRKHKEEPLTNIAIKHDCYTIKFDDLIKLIRKEKHIKRCDYIYVYEDPDADRISFVGNIHISQDDIIKVIENVFNITVMSFYKNYWHKYITFIAAPDKTNE